MSFADDSTTGGAVENQAPQDDSEVLNADLNDAMVSEIDALKTDARDILRRRHELVVLRRNLNNSQHAPQHNAP